MRAACRARRRWSRRWRARPPIRQASRRPAGGGPSPGSTLSFANGPRRSSGGRFMPGSLPGLPRTVHAHVLGLAADAEDERVQVAVGARRLAVDRVGRDDEVVARSCLNPFGATGPELDRDRAPDNVDVGVVGGMVMPATDVTGVVRDPAAQADPATLGVVALALVQAGRRRTDDALVRVENNGLALAHGAHSDPRTGRLKLGVDRHETRAADRRTLALRPDSENGPQGHPGA